MARLENEQFLAELAKMFQSSRSSGVVTVTMKRYDGRTKPKPKRVTKTSEHILNADKCLFRARHKMHKICTVISAKDVNKFQLAYATLMKSSMDGLKKRRAVTGRQAVSGRAMKAEH